MNNEPNIGELATGEARRDAIHVAVILVTAKEKLKPSQKVDKNGSTEDKLVGIVDPYLEKPVLPGQKFWLFLKPKTVTSLRHVWTHPDFEEEKEEFISKENMDKLVDEVSKKPSIQWIEDFASEIGQSYELLMAGASKYLNFGDYTYDNSERYKNIPYTKWKEFWSHYEIINETKIPKHTKEDNFFTCSC